MATPNRFTNLTPSRFNPLSFQEVIAAPMMKRKQHDDLLAQQELLRSGLAKVDPLEVHTNEALQLKSDINNQIQAQAESLAKEGINPNSQSQILSLNRKYNDLISPTGRLGQINAAKKAFYENRDNFVADAVKKGFSREDALYNWQQTASKYTGYDAKQGIKNIDPLGAPNYVNLQEDLKAVKSMLGEETLVTLRNSGYSLQQGPNGSLIMVDRSGRRVETSNNAAINNALEYLNGRYFVPGGEGYESTRFQRTNPLLLQQQINTGIGMMRERKQDENISNNTSIHGFTAKDPVETNLEAVNVEAVNTSGNSNLLNELEGKNAVNTEPIDIVLARSGAYARGDRKIKNSQIRKANLEKTLQSPEYRNIAYGLIRNNPDLKGLRFDNPKVQEEVKKYLTENKDVTIQNRYVDPFVNETGKLFASKEISKDKKASSDLMMERALQGAYEVRDTSGKVIKPEDLSKYNFSYSGDMTPKSQIGKIFNNPKQNIGARRGILTDKENGESVQVYISRGADDFNTPQFKAMQTINSISKIADTKPGIYHKVNGDLFSNYGLKDVEIKYNKGKKTYNLSYTDNDGSHVDSEFSDDKFQEFILNAHNGIK